MSINLLIQNDIKTWNPQKKLIKSPLNYVGGKFKLLTQLIPLFPKNINVFLDLFSGGANVGINIDAKHHKFNDLNYKVNELFRYFQDEDIDQILGHIDRNIVKYKLTKCNEEGFKELRNYYNDSDSPNPMDLYTLVCYSYNYQFRFNNSLKYNNPFGRNRSHFSDNMRKNLIEFTNRLQAIDAEFTDIYFSDYPYQKLGENDFVYADPPYLITTGSYNDGNRGFIDWSVEQEYELYELLDKCTEKKIRFALSNVLSHKGKINHGLKDWSEGYFISELNYSYNNASYNSKGISEEVLITNYNPQTFEIERSKKKRFVISQPKQLTLFD